MIRISTKTKRIEIYRVLYDKEYVELKYPIIVTIEQNAINIATRRPIKAVSYKRLVFNKIKLEKENVNSICDLIPVTFVNNDIMIVPRNSVIAYIDNPYFEDWYKSWYHISLFGNNIKANVTDHIINPQVCYFKENKI